MNERSSKEYWNKRVLETSDLRTLVYSHSYYDEFDQHTRNLLSIFRNADVLDVGCGYGRLSDCFTNYTGIDFSEEMIKKAKELYPDKEFMVSDGLTQMMGSKFDVIFECMCLSSLEITPEQFRDKYANMAKIIITIEPHETRVFYI